MGHHLPGLTIRYDHDMSTTEMVPHHKVTQNMERIIEGRCRIEKAENQLSSTI
jgi:hypothetical protein